MPDAVCFIDWKSFNQGPDGCGFFSQNPLTFNSRQSRLHEVGDGDHIWLVSRKPHDKQYYIVSVLRVAERRTNLTGSDLGEQYGEYGVIAHRTGSYDLGITFPAEVPLRSLIYESGNPIKHGSNIGQSIQSIRFLDPVDTILVNYCLYGVLSGRSPQPGACGLWTKCQPTFADYFNENWRAFRRPQAFLLYDSPPTLPPGSPVFVHSDKCIRLLARYRECQFVAGYKRTIDDNERERENQRIFQQHRTGSLLSSSKESFDEFWENQHSVRSLIVMDNIVVLPDPPQFKDYGNALEWGYPTSVGWRDLDLFQTYYLMRICKMEAASRAFFLGALLH